MTNRSAGDKNPSRPPLTDPTGPCEFIDPITGNACGSPGQWALPEHPACYHHRFDMAVEYGSLDREQVRRLRIRRWQLEGRDLWLRIMKETPLPVEDA